MEQKGTISFEEFIDICSHVWLIQSANLQRIRWLTPTYGLSSQMDKRRSNIVASCLS